MWLSFAFTYLAAVLFVMFPGLLITRALRFPMRESLALAPVVSVASHASFAVAFGIAGIGCSWLTLLGAGLVVALLVWGCSALCSARTSIGTAFAPRLDEPLCDIEALRWLTWGRVCVCGALFVGVLTTSFVLFPNIGTPDAFAQNFDNAFHMTRARTFLDTGTYSSLMGGFYPSAWHCLVAMASSATGVTIPVAANAVNAAIASVAFPLSSLCLLAALFPSEPRRVMLGCFVCTAIAFFPWRLMLFGPLYPNILAFSLMPAVCAVFVRLCGGMGGPSGGLARLVGLFVVGGVSLALAQPNAIFSAGVFLAPFCLWRIWGGLREAGRSRLLCAACVAVVTLAAAGAWLFMYLSPTFREIVTYPRDVLTNTSQAIRWVFSFSFVLRRPQYVIACVVALGGLSALFSRKHRWLTFSYVALALLYVVAVSRSGIVRSLLAGFWYSDYYRLAAAVCVFAVPLAAIGCDRIVDALVAVRSGISSRLALPKAAGRGILAVMTVAVSYALVAFNVFPFDFVPETYRAYGFDAVMWEIRDSYKEGTRGPLDGSEREFLEKVRDTVPEGSLVINQPYDGSVMAYANNDINVLFNTYSVAETPDLNLLRLSLASYSSNPQVRDVVERLGASYVLQLDHGTSPTGMSPEATFYDYKSYVPEDWFGINAVGDATPGFKVVLSSGDMRLYEIAK